MVSLDSSLKVKSEIEDSTSSAVSETSEGTSTILAESSHFSQPKSLAINTRGIGAFRLPLAPSDLEICIYHPDGSLAYTSTRGTRSSGDSILSCPKSGNLISTSYFFGPGRPPVIRYIQPFDSSKTDEIKIQGKWTSRSQTFSSPDGKMFEWSYVREKGPDGRKTTLIVLHEKEASVKAAQGKRLAQLVRTDETRAPDSSKCSAGNGGQLVLDEDACNIGLIDEALIVTTCLVMLKKEVDRRRTIQMATISAAVSGGS